MPCGGKAAKFVPGEVAAGRPRSSPPSHGWGPGPGGCGSAGRECTLDPASARPRPPLLPEVGPASLGKGPPPARCSRAAVGPLTRRTW